MKLFILSLSLLVTLSVQAAKPKPNFIIIFTDDQGWADLGCQGVRGDVKTPHLDALAASGVRCTAGYITAPQCSPSRAGLLTGRYQQRFGLEEIPDTPMPTGERTIAERLKPAGYVSGMVGKWHLDASPSSLAWIKRNPKSVSRTPGKPLAIAEPARLALSPAGQGFDEFYMNNRERCWANFRADGTSLKPGGEWITESTGDRLDDETAGALAFIERNHARPFFLYLAYSGPHTPLEATPERLARFPGEMPARRRTALAMLATIDDGVGQIMAKLRKHGLEENTLIVFTSDNGAPLKMTMPDAPMTKGPDGKQNDMGGWDGSINAPQLGEKGMLTEGGIREPFLWSWKGVLPAGKVYDHPVSSLDIASTLLSAAGIAERDGLDGVNVVPHLTGTILTPPHEALYWRFWKQAAVRVGDWKLIHLGDGTDFLFDLSQPDPETKNLAAEHPDKVTELRAKLEAWTQQLRPPGLPKNGIQRERQWYEHFLHHAAASPP
jgi:arylsulfatase A-like enzyme